MPEIITIIVADDHALVRRGLAATLNDEEDFRVVGEAETGPQAVALDHRPHIAILDINMPGCGLKTSLAIRAALPDTRTVMFSFRQDQDIVLHSQNAGASGYIVKGSSRLSILNALRRVHFGSCFLYVGDSD